MAKNSNIQWTDNTFNPWIGCTKVSEGCQECYAEKDDRYRHWTPQGWGAGRPRHRTSSETWKNPLRWERQAVTEGRRYKVFCASLADIFDQEVDPAWRHDLWELIRKCPHLDWQILTKRPQHIATGLPVDWGTGWENVWLGTSVENQKRADERIPLLVAVPAVVHFLSVEPLLEPICFRDLSGVEWLIVGGESGSKARPIAEKWVIDIQSQSQAAGCAFFFKQWGGARKEEAGRLLQGNTYDGFPV
jgi:protein gp37